MLVIPTMTFDTYKYIERLRSAGVPEAQAKAEMEALTEALASSGQGLVTAEHFDKGMRAIEPRFVDIDKRFSEIDKRFSEMKAEIANIKVEIIKWLAPLLLGQAGLIVALVKLL